MTLSFPMKDLLVSSVLTVFWLAVIFTHEAEGNQNRGSHDEGKFNQIEFSLNRQNCQCWHLYIAEISKEVKHNF